MIRCPDTARYTEDLVGCGSFNVSGPDNEGIYDCHDCGLFFNADSCDLVGPVEDPRCGAVPAFTCHDFDFDEPALTLADWHEHTLRSYL